MDKKPARRKAPATKASIAPHPIINAPNPLPPWDLSFVEKQTFPDIDIFMDANTGNVEVVIIAPTDNNFKHMMKIMRLVYAHNSITKLSATNAVPGGMLSIVEGRDLPNVVLSRILSMYTKNGISTSHIQTFMKGYFGEHMFNPVVRYLEQLKWDRVERFSKLEEFFNATNEQASKTFVRIFLLQAVAMADACEQSPHPDKVPKGEYMPLMAGDQGAKKSTVFNAVVPEALRPYVGSVSDLDPDNKGSLLNALSFWIAEVGEIDTLFKRKETERYKAFLSMSIDKIRKPYGKEAVNMKRRTSFCATVNPVEGALNDPTGNRRYIPITIDGKLNHKLLKDLDLDQLWARGMASIP